MVFVAALICAIFFLQKGSKPGKKQIPLSNVSQRSKHQRINSSNETKKINNRSVARTPANI